MLVGRGAEGFARESGMEVLGDEEGGMVSPRARREWEVWRRRLEEAERRKEGSDVQDGEGLVGLNDRQDTVGAIALDAAGNVAAGVSRYVLSQSIRAATTSVETNRLTLTVVAYY